RRDRQGLQDQAHARLRSEDEAARNLDAAHHRQREQLGDGEAAVRRSVLVALALAGAALVAPAGASAAGFSTVALGGSGLTGLKGAGVGLKATKPARASSKTVYLPVSGGSVTNSSAVLRHGGSLVLTYKKTSVTLSSLELRLASKPVVRARVGGKT